MGIFIYLNISKSVTKEEWAKVYEETLVLVKNLPFAERRSVKIHGIDTVCLVPTEERKARYGWYEEKTRTGWFADGDYIFMDTAECYFLPKDLVEDDQIDPDAGDAMISKLQSCLEMQWDDELFQHTYQLWGNKTQGEQYHMYLLAVACLIEARLGDKAYTSGDITRGQCRKAVEIANQYLKTPIEMPDRCYADRLARRVSRLPISEKEKLTVFEHAYLGKKDAEFGDCMRNYFDENTIEDFWKEKLGQFEVGMYGFDSLFNKYMTMGFELEKLCGYVKLQDKDGNDQHGKFIKRVMDAKLHIKDKNCADMLEIDPEAEGTYSIWTLLMQFGFAGARNKKADRYIPIEEVRRALKAGLTGFDDVDQLIDQYLEKEAEQIKIDREDAFSSDEKMEEAIDQDASEVFQWVMDKNIENLQKMQEEYDIIDFKNLKFYEVGDTIRPGLEKSLGKSRKFLDSILDEETFTELMAKDALARCRWIVEQNRHILIRDKDWEKIFTDIEEHKESFGRYYSIQRAKMDSDEIVDMGAALMINDRLYEYSKVLADQISEDLH